MGIGIIVYCLSKLTFVKVKVIHSVKSCHWFKGSAAIEQRERERGSVIARSCYLEF